MRSGRFADARDAFLRSLELNPRPSVAFNLAVAHSRTGEYVAAVVLFERLLAGDFGDLPGERRREAESLMVEAEASIATLVVHLPPVEGLNVRVDGRVYRENMRLDPGAHFIIERLCRGQIDPRPPGIGEKCLGIGRFAAGGPSEH